MYKLIFVSLLFALFVYLLIFFIYSITTRKYKCNILTMSMNDFVAKDYPILIKMITVLVEPYSYFTIIPDNIIYLDHNFRWPTNHMYVHLSDVQNFISDNKKFFKGRKIVQQEQFINVLEDFINEKAIKLKD